MIGLLSRLWEALLGHISLDLVIWIESMAEEPAARHRSLAVRGGAGARAGDLLHMTRFGRTQGGSSAPSFSVRRTVPRRCRSSTSSKTVSGTLPGHWLSVRFTNV